MHFTTNESPPRDYLRLSKDNWWEIIRENIEQVGLKSFQLEDEYQEWLRWHHIPNSSKEL